ncbi:WD domain, G-beta repeat, putative [Angomonas deanei]|uniref:WD domain, G-beta repeat, putative n=1 Tax=Angomonas deanei TaxID=59799 RepID=A0A7G2C7W3_9TRYP|nr:WD domain, G-beta repeat, putative [Angomonas deanei]
MGCQAKRIKCVDVSATGNLMAVAHRDDCSVHIYSTTSGAEVVSLRGHGDSLLAVKFSPNPKFIATASRDSLLVIWDRTVGLEYQFVEHPGIVTAISFSFDGKHIYSGCQDDTLRKITSPKANLVVENDDFEAPEDAELSIIVSIATQHTRDRYVLFSRSCNKCAYLADAETLNVAATLKGHNSLVLNTGFNADDTCFFTACDSKIILWNYSLAQLFCFDSRTVSPDPSIKMCWTTVAFGPMMKESLLYAFASSGQLLVYDIRTFKPIMDLYFRSDIRTVSQSSYQGKSVCGDDLGNVYVIKTM